MNIKLDENLPGRLGPLFASRGHDVDTVVDEDLAGAPDSTVASAASAVGRLVVTMDRGFGDVRRYPPGSHAGILVLRLDDQAAPALAAAVEDLLDSVDVDDLAGCVAVYRDGDLRVRRPPGRG